MLNSEKEAINRPLRVVFAGTPEFALRPLQTLLDEACEVVGVLTQPDRPAGRGKKLTASPVKQLATEYRLPILQPQTLRDPEVQAQLKALQADLMVVVAYGLMVPADVLNMPRLGCWNIHASLLPRWRGAAPIQRAIEAGDASTGVCIMQMETTLDTGPVYHRLSTDISAKDTGGSLHDRLAKMGANALRTCLQSVKKGQLVEPEPQDHDKAVYAHKLSKAEAQLDWQQPAQILERQIRAFNPWPVSWCEIDAQRLRIWSAEVAELEKPLLPGEVRGSHEALYIGTPDKALSVLQLQRAGGQKMPVTEFMKAYPQGIKHT
jgi:methionyl-tRNA formyltransferase